MEGSIKIRKQREDKDKLEGSMKVRRRREDKDIEGSMRVRKQKDEKNNDVVEGSMRARRRREDKDPLEGSMKEGRKGGSDVSERRRKGGSIRRRVMKLVSTLRQRGKESAEATDKVSTKEKVGKGGINPTDAQKAVFEAFVKEIFEMGVDGLLKEYAVLKPYLAANYTREIFDQNPTKNRYKDVICNDLTRVSIQDGKGSDYIHANYVKGDYLQNTFICTQGPIITTIYDFWRMVISEHVSHIIMLCETVEQGKMKCEQYWPAGQDEKLVVEDITLTNIKISSTDIHVTRTTIEIQVGERGPKQLVKHHQWKTWPDKTVPKSLLAVFRILQMVRLSTKPILVHCSAGIGRTGSFVAIEMCLQTLLAGQKLSMLETCKKLRDQRMHSVQVEVQYVYIAEALCEYGKAMGFWSGSELLDQYTKFKETFDEYVSRLPVPGAPAPQAAPALQQDPLAPQQAYPTPQQAVPGLQPAAFAPQQATPVPQQATTAPNTIAQGQPGAPVQQPPRQSPPPNNAPQQNTPPPIIAPQQNTPPPLPPVTQLKNKFGIPEKAVEPIPATPLQQTTCLPAATPQAANAPPRMPQAVPGQPFVPHVVNVPARIPKPVPAKPPRQTVPGPPRQTTQTVRAPPLVSYPAPGQQQVSQSRPNTQGGPSAQQPSQTGATTRVFSDLSLRRYKNKKSSAAAAGVNTNTSAVKQENCSVHQCDSVYVNNP